jgi:L-lactate utilization protein LutC
MEEGTVLVATASRDDFFRTVRQALGHGEGRTPAPSATALSRSKADVDADARRVREVMQRDAVPLLAKLAETAGQNGWKVFRAPSLDAAADYVRDVVRELEARSAVRTEHDVLNRMKLDLRLADTGLALQVMAQGFGLDRAALRQKAIEANLGITGADYAIAETGSCVLIPRQGVSRIASLVPPVHVAVVERGQVLPSLDDLFTLRRDDFLDGSLGSYMNIISGPSRSADIEYTLITGVHGPGEVHMVLVG